MIQQLQNLYPDSLLNPNKNEMEDIHNYYIVETAEDQLFISFDRLNSKEIELLNLLTNKNSLNHLKNSVWENLLFDRIVDELLPVETIRIVYLHSSHLEERNFQVWKETLMDSLYEVNDVIFVTNDLIMIILDSKKWGAQSLNTFSEVIQSLDQDFNLLTQGMIGQVANVNRQTTDVFEYERDVFQSFIKSSKVDGIVMLSDLLIDTIGVEMKKNSPQLPKLFNYIAEKSDTQMLVHHLFENQGNLSQTADALYIHRNTLTYRINQFQEKTGFNLAYFPDLIVCYLLVD